jgi:hypothetical protein
MWSYYLFMALMIVTLVLWAIIALRDDTRDSGGPSKPGKDAATEKSKKPGD